MEVIGTYKKEKYTGLVYYIILSNGKYVEVDLATYKHYRDLLRYE